MWRFFASFLGSSRVCTALLALVAAACLLPALSTGLSRDDWLLLWSAHGGAPAGAGGVFPRPLAQAQWWSSVALFGDATWPMHAGALLAWVVLGATLWRRMARDGISRASSTLALAWCVSHGALFEPRLWAAASNGIWAVALAWVALELAGRDRSWRPVEFVLWVAAALLRADALALLALRLPGMRGRRSGWVLPLVLLGVGSLTLGWMLRSGGAWEFRPQDAGRALRLLVVPYGPPLPSVVQAGLAAAMALGALVGWIRLRAPAGPRAVAAWTAVAVVAAFALTSWSAAGRYLLVPATLLVPLMADRLDALGRAPHPARGQTLARGALWLLVGLGLVSAQVGHSSRDLRARATAETSLYFAVLERADSPAFREARSVEILDAPPVGWTSSAADLENVVSAALRRPVAVELLPSGGPPRLRFAEGEWKTGDAPKMP